MGTGSKVGGGARTSTQLQIAVPTLNPSLLSSNETSGSHTAEISNTKSSTELQTLLQWRAFCFQRHLHTHTGSF